jgi:hypothetical protein
MPRILPDWIATYLEYTKLQEAPTAFHFWTGVSTIAAALRRKVWFDQMYYLWSPNFYIILVAPPGVSTKSSAINIGMKMLDDIQGIKRGADSLTWQSLVQSMENAVEMIQVANGEFLAISCLTFSSSELGSLLDPDDRKMLDVLTDLWDGKSGTWEKHTKNCGSNVIPNPWINIIAGTTPHWIADNFPRQAIGAGFTSRCVFVYAEKKHHLMAYPRYRMVKDNNFAHMQEIKKHLLHDLEQIAMMQGEYDLTPEAIEWGEAWYKAHHEKPPELLDHDEQFGGYLNRKQGHTHKLAMVLAASKSNALVIDKPTLEAAVMLASQLEVNMPEVFKHINTAPGQDLALRVVEKVRTTGPITKGALYRMFVRQMGEKEYNDSLNSAIAAGMLTVFNKDNTFFVAAI